MWPFVLPRSSPWRSTTFQSPSPPDPKASQPKIPRRRPSSEAHWAPQGRGRWAGAPAGAHWVLNNFDHNKKACSYFSRCPRSTQQLLLKSGALAAWNPITSELGRDFSNKETQQRDSNSIKAKARSPGCMTLTLPLSGPIASSLK